MLSSLRKNGLTSLFTEVRVFKGACRCRATPPKNLGVAPFPPPPVPGGVAPKFGSEKVSRYTGVSQLQLRVSRYTVQLRLDNNGFLCVFHSHSPSILGLAPLCAERGKLPCSLCQWGSTWNIAQSTVFPDMPPHSEAVRPPGANQWWPWGPKAH